MTRKKTTIASTILSKRNVSIFIIIVVTAFLVSAVSYQYSSFISNEIFGIASGEIRSNAKIEVHDLSQILANRIESTRDLLQTLAESPVIRNNNNNNNNEYERAGIAVDAAQRASGELTDFYMWLDKNGKLNWISNINQTVFKKYKGTDLSYRSYFTIPKETHTEYYSSLIESDDNITRLYISYPILNTTSWRANTSSIKETTGGDEVFNGVVVASIRVETLGNVLKSYLFRGFQSNIALLDRGGTILYSDSPLLYRGENVFGDKMQSAFSSFLSTQRKDSLNDLFDASLQGKTSDSEDIILAQGKMNTIAYEPVILNGNYFLTPYIIAPHTLANNVQVIVDQHKNFGTFTITIIAVVSFGIAFLVLLWNKRLESTVNIRTAELKEANDSLTKSIKLLAAANEQLKSHDKMQNEFINIASHELRTPIQPILNLTEVIRSKIKEPHQEELLDIITRNAKRLKRLTDDLLDVSKIESHSLNLRREKFNLKDVITNSISDIVTNRYVNKYNKTHVVKVIYQPRDFFVEADKARITQVISNLLSNAVKFTEEKGGDIHVNTETINGQVLISVKDSGNGIDHEIMPKLFSKFTSKSYQGTGLGLFIAKSIVEAHGGKISAENNSDGKAGAIFTFTLPIGK